MMFKYIYMLHHSESQGVSTKENLVIKLHRLFVQIPKDATWTR